MARRKEDTLGALGIKLDTRLRTSSAHASLTYSFPDPLPAKLGIAFVGQTSHEEQDEGAMIFVVGSIVHGSQATKYAPDLCIGMVLERVQGSKIRGESYRDVMSRIKNSPRPLKLCFEAMKRKGRARAPSEDLLSGVQPRKVVPASPTDHLHDPWREGKETYERVDLAQAELSSLHLMAVWVVAAVLVGGGVAARSGGGFPSLTGPRAASKAFSGNLDEFLEAYLAQSCTDDTDVNTDCRMLHGAGTAIVAVLACLASPRLLTLLAFVYAGVAGYVACELMQGLPGTAWAEFGVLAFALLASAKVFTDSVLHVLIILALYGALLLSAYLLFPAAEDHELLLAYPTYSVLGELLASRNLLLGLTGR